MVEWPVLVAQQAAVSIAIGGVGLQAHLAPGQQFCQPLGGDVGQALTAIRRTRSSVPSTSTLSVSPSVTPATDAMGPSGRSTGPVSP